MEEKEKKAIAKKIWDIPFASSNLDKLTKQELVILTHSMLDRVTNNEEWFELDLKDLFEQKCWLIECLDNNFFKREK